MNHKTEHLNLDKKGDVLGLWDVDVSRLSGADLWNKVEAVISEYAKVHRLEMEIIVRQNAQTRRDQISNSQIRKKGGSMIRWGANIPHGLLFKLEQVEPRLFSDKKLFYKFLNKYNGFRICQEV